VLQTMLKLRRALVRISGRARAPRRLNLLCPASKVVGKAVETLAARSSLACGEMILFRRLRQYHRRVNSSNPRRYNRSVKADPLLQAVACIGSAYLQRYGCANAKDGTGRAVVMRRAVRAAERARCSSSCGVAAMVVSSSDCRGVGEAVKPALAGTASSWSAKRGACSVRRPSGGCCVPEAWSSNRWGAGEAVASALAGATGSLSSGARSARTIEASPCGLCIGAVEVRPCESSSLLVSPGGQSHNMSVNADTQQQEAAARQFVACRLPLR